MTRRPVPKASQQYQCVTRSTISGRQVHARPWPPTTAVPRRGPGARSNLRLGRSVLSVPASLPSSCQRRYPGTGSDWARLRDPASPVTAPDPRLRERPRVFFVTIRDRSAARILRRPSPASRTSGRYWTGDCMRLRLSGARRLVHRHIGTAPATAGGILESAGEHGCAARCAPYRLASDRASIGADTIESLVAQRRFAAGVTGSLPRRTPRAAPP